MLVQPNRTEAVTRMNNDDRLLETRIRRLEDLNEVRALCIAYGYHIDRQDFYSYAICSRKTVVLGQVLLVNSKVRTPFLRCFTR